VFANLISFSRDKCKHRASRTTCTFYAFQSTFAKISIESLQCHVPEGYHENLGNVGTIGFMLHCFRNGVRNETCVECSGEKDVLARISLVCTTDSKSLSDHHSMVPTSLPYLIERNCDLENYMSLSHLNLLVSMCF
jgi:hypothetical protein